MRRKPSKNTPPLNSEQKRFQDWIRLQKCSILGCNSYHSECDHIWGGSKKIYLGVERVHVGEWACVPLCHHHHREKSQLSRKCFEGVYGKQIDYWLEFIAKEYPSIPNKVIEAMKCEAGPLFYDDRV